MNDELIELILQMNPWLVDGNCSLISQNYIPRLQVEKLLSPEWDSVWTILIGPRQAGKTTLGFCLSNSLLSKQRFTELLYLNCDSLEVRQWLRNALFLKEAMVQFKLKRPIIFIDEVQRLENPGLLLKTIADMKLPIKLMASGSSQLEIKSKVQEFLTGRQIESLVLPLSYEELGELKGDELIFGCYPAVTKLQDKATMLQQLYRDYISKDIVTFLKIGKADAFEKLLTLIAHNSGQLVNYQQYASDCRTSSPTIQQYISILEKTYVIVNLKPFVGNKRKEITANPICYFLDNGFRNQALRNFTALETRTDMGFLVQSAVCQELMKLKYQHYLSMDIHYWRTQSGAEVDFVIEAGESSLIPIEVNYRTMQSAFVSKSFHSFIDAYQPEIGFYITKDFHGNKNIKGCEVHFVPFKHLNKMLSTIKNQQK